MLVLLPYHFHTLLVLCFHTVSISIRPSFSTCPHFLLEDERRASPFAPQTLSQNIIAHTPQYPQDTINQPNMLARALPVALRSWTPTLRVELVQLDHDRSDDDR